MGVMDHEKKTGAELLADGIKRQQARVQPPRPAEPQSKVSDDLLGVEEALKRGLRGPAPLRVTSDRPRNGMLGFHWTGTCWSSEPCSTFFMPAGLFIVGVLPLDALLTQSYVGFKGQVTRTHDGVPAHFFMQGKTYEQIAEQVAQGATLPSWCDWDMVQLGETVRIEIRARAGELIAPGTSNPGDEYDLGMWGVYAQ